MSGVQEGIVQAAQTAQHGLFHGLEDVLIPGAAAQMAGQQLAQLVVGVVHAPVQDLHRRHDKARGAEAALNGRLLHKGLLDVGQLTVGAHKPLQGGDVLALGPHGQVQAGVVALAVDEDVAGAAFAHLAALLHGGHGEVAAPHIRQGCPDVHPFFHFPLLQYL